MSSPPPLQCLFCNHLNPGGASFCNDCGSQMHLQPCDRCGAINKRTAKHCHKCESSFTLPGATGPEAERRLSSPLLEESTTGFANTASPDHAGMTDQPPQFYQLVTPQNEVQNIRAKTRSAWRPKALAAVVAASALAAYFYWPQQKPVVNEPVATAPVQEAPPTAVSAVVAAPAIAQPMEAASSHATTAPPRATIKSTPDKTIAMAPPGAGPAPQPVLPTTMADTTARPMPSLLKECPDAVAALGVCNPGAKPEKP